MDGTTLGVVVTTFCMGGALIAFTIYLVLQVLPERRAQGRAGGRPPARLDQPQRRSWGRQFRGNT